MAFQPGSVLYTQGFGSRPENIEVPHIDIRDPGINDFGWPIGKIWVNRIDNQAFILTSITSFNGTSRANWETIVYVPPTPPPILYPITPYVVGPVGQADYQTIQSAMNAAFSANPGGAQIYIQPGVYNENLTFRGNQAICSFYSEGLVNIFGTHTLPPSVNTVTLDNLIFTTTSGNLIEGGSILNSSNVLFQNCEFNITNGYIFHGTGSLVQSTITIKDSIDLSTICGIISCPNAFLVGINSTLGAGSSSGSFRNAQLTDCYIPRQVDLTLAASANIFYNSVIGGTITLTGTASLSCYNCQFIAAKNSSNSCVNLSSATSPGTFYNCTFLSSAANCIVGLGALTLFSCSYSPAAPPAGTFASTTIDGTFVAQNVTASGTVSGVHVIGTTDVKWGGSGGTKMGALTTDASRVYVAPGQNNTILDVHSTGSGFLDFSTGFISEQKSTFQAEALFNAGVTLANSQALKYIASNTTSETCGVTNLVAGTATVITSSVAIGDFVFVTPQDLGAMNFASFPFVAVGNGSFVISTTDNTNNYSVNWFIIKNVMTEAPAAKLSVWQKVKNFFKSKKT